MKGVTISEICTLSGVNRQRYYRMKWSENRKMEKAEKVVGLVSGVRRTMPRVGGRKLQVLLKSELEPLGVGRDTLFGILRANHMLVAPYRSYHTTTNSHHRFHKHKNLIAGMTVTRPEQVWVSDITYIGNRTNNMYLSLITDAYSKKIVGYNLSDSLNTEGPILALKMAQSNRMYKTAALIHHSDRGIQYCSDSYQKLLNKYRITPSMTESYDPYANAIAERVNGILKQEFSLEKINQPLSIMRKVVKESVDIYNGIRPHCSCNYLTPNWVHTHGGIIVKQYKNKKSPLKQISGD
jgi:transposase InsO family protein